MFNNTFLVIDAQAQLNFKSLTKHRVPGAIPVLGKYRLIDIAISSATESNITNVGVFCDRNYRSLHDHIGDGARFNLARRVDGIFILPPKSSNPVDEEFLSFQRMKSQDDYFRRSNQEYSIIMPSTIFWFPNLEEFVKNHIESEKDITEIVNKNGERLYTFIIKKEKLMTYIENYSTISYRNLCEVFDYSNQETKNTIIYDRYAKYIRTLDEYYKMQMGFIGSAFPTGLERLEKVRAKDQFDSPTYYGSAASVKSTIMTSGCFIDGTVENSILSRRVRVEEGAVIKNSIIMNNCIIKKNAYLVNAILDKESIVEEGAVVVGTSDDPFVSEKKQTVFSAKHPRVAMLSAECSPYVKRGGLADMVGSLAREIAHQGSEVYLFIPLYKEIRNKHQNESEKREELDITIFDKTYHIGVFKKEIEKLTYILLDLYMFFDREEIYGYDDDRYRFAYFTYAVFEYLKSRNIEIDVFHIHDWHMCLLPLFKKKYEMYQKSLSVLTIHNLSYQGTSDKDVIEHFKLDYSIEGPKVSFLEIGINTADILNTVSKTYAEELKYEYYSGNLREAIMRRTPDFYGIVNGLSSKLDPNTDVLLASRYSIDDEDLFIKKEINKKYLSDICGFEYSSDMFIMGMVSRIDSIKGFDLITNALYSLLENKKIHFVLLGIGDPLIISRLKEIEERYKSQVKLFLDFYGTEPSYIYSGADVFLMPSRIEPCGTSQMIALKYGTVPIVRQTGGLNDTISSYDRTSKSGNGFKFYNQDYRDLISAINLAYSIYSTNRNEWEILIKNGMRSEFSFKKCAKEYLNLYSIERK